VTAADAMAAVATEAAAEVAVDAEVAGWEAAARAVLEDREVEMAEKAAAAAVCRRLRRGRHRGRTYR
jgi:hypothetical protein